MSSNSVPRVTGDLVKEIFDTSLSSPQLQPFVLAAFRLVEDNLTGRGINATTLVEIERYLAAHFASSMAPNVKSENIAGEYSVTYDTGMLGEGLKSTRYGQMALTLDHTKTLESLSGKRAKMKIKFE